MAGSQGMMRSKFGASEMRLNMLDTFAPLEYPVTVYRDVWDVRQTAEYDTIADLVESGRWPEALNFIGEHHYLINAARPRSRPLEADDADLVQDEAVKTLLWTPLHWAAVDDRAGIEVILKLLHFGSLKCLKTGLGETAHDIAVRMGRPANIVTLLEEPDVVMENMKVIETVEAAVHRIIQERAGDRLRATGAQLPQLAVLWEMSNECGESLLYPVYGMRGGFSLDLDHEDNSVTVVGWSRGEGEHGGEVRHCIDREGGVKAITDILENLSVATEDVGVET